MLLHLPNKKGAYMAGVSMNKFEQFVENAYRGIPEQTSTVEEKEKYISKNFLFQNNSYFFLLY